jgi:hypothetical protein
MWKEALTSTSNQVVNVATERKEKKKKVGRRRLFVVPFVCFGFGLWVGRK